MKTRVALLLLFFVTSVASAQERDVVVTGGWLFASTSNDRVRNPGILIRAGKILRVGGDLSIAAADAERVQVADTETVVPGLLRSPRALRDGSVRRRSKGRDGRVPAAVPRERRHVHLPGGRDGPERDARPAHPHRERRESRSAPHELRTVLRHRAPELESRDHPRADLRRDRSLGGDGHQGHSRRRASRPTSSRR